MAPDGGGAAIAGDRWDGGGVRPKRLASCVEEDALPWSTEEDEDALPMLESPGATISSLLCCAIGGGGARRAEMDGELK
jgi:hypothetical protein